MIVKVLSQTQFNITLDKNAISDKTVDQFSKSIFISICGHGDNHYFKFNHDNVLNIKFDDLSDEEFKRVNRADLVLFTEEHARKIIAFLEKNRDKNYCWVHCAAGVSRSGAVGTFINDHFSDVHYFNFMDANRNIKPNSYILSVLNKVYYEGDRSGKQERLPG